MDYKTIKYELQHILSGKSGNSYDAVIQAVAYHLRSRKKASPMAKTKHQDRGKETAKLLEYIRQYDFLYDLDTKF